MERPPTYARSIVLGASGVVNGFVLDGAPGAAGVGVSGVVMLLGV